MNQNINNLGVSNIFIKQLKLNAINIIIIAFNLLKMHIVGKHNKTISWDVEGTHDQTTNIVGR